MENDSKNQNKELQLQFLISEHQTAADERWKINERTLDIYKYFITVISGFGALFLALLSFGLSLRETKIFLSKIGVIALLIAVYKNRGIFIH